MPQTGDMNHARHIRKQVILLLAELYLFPQSDRVIASALRGRLPGLDARKVRDVFTYLEKKGYVITNRGRNGSVTARITASGVDLAEGAVRDRGVAPTAPDFAGLANKRELRHAVLSYCRQFPDAFNGDDEIHHELKEMGMANLLLDRVRFSIWYLDGKGLVEMKTHPLHGDLVFLARITGKGIDLVEGSVADPGVTGDE